MLLMIDNFDSFTYNLVQYFGELGADVRVFRNDDNNFNRFIKPSLLKTAKTKTRQLQHQVEFACRHYGEIRPNAT